MKTTVELPAQLLQRLKATAALQGRSMKELITEALEELLGPNGPRGGGWRTVFGRATRAAVGEVNRHIKDLERVDLEDWK